MCVFISVKRNIWKIETVSANASVHEMKDIAYGFIIITSLIRSHTKFDTGLPSSIMDIDVPQ